MPESRASDQWLKREDAVLEASGAYFGLATVDIGAQKDVTLKAGVTVYQGSTPWNSLGTVTLSAYSTHAYTSNTTGVVKTGAGELYSLSVFAASCPTITLWDNIVPSGTQIASLPPNLAVQTWYFRRTLTTGLTIEGAAGEVPNIIIGYK